MDTASDRAAADSRPAHWPAEKRRSLARAIERAQAWLLARQHPAGHWVGELEADASVAAGYIPVMHYMLGHVDPQRQQKVVNYVLDRQGADGSWNAYHGGPGDLSVSVQVYLALKLAGLSASDPRLARARAYILSQGGAGRVNVITRVWLALFGQFPWRYTPSVPPETILLPGWFPLSIYDLASWSRATAVALSLVLTLKPICPVPASAGISELYVEPEGQRRYPLGQGGGLFSWRRLFLAADALLKLYDRLPVQPGRRLAIERTARWILAHQEADGSWGGIMLPWVYSLLALKALGYPRDHPAIARGLQGLEGFVIEDETTLRLQPATSPVWDTAWTVLALRASGLPGAHPAVRQAAGWLLDQEIRTGGDWQIKNRGVQPACWAFEFENDLYPDLDDTAVVCRALRRVELEAAQRAVRAAELPKAVQWAITMQCRDGGWAAFDRDNDKRILGHIPFADFMSPLDPTCADVTAHVVELLAELRAGGDALARAMAYLRRTQEPDGSWYGRWGVNYIYGTGLALAALQAAGEPATSEHLRRGAEWLARHQNPDGGWGESCGTYHDPRLRGRGSSTPSQTAWALLGLMAAGAADEAVERGVEYLLRRQREDGSWPEEAYTGTGFPRAFYLKYELYPQYFPLLALARFQQSRP